MLHILNASPSRPAFEQCLRYLRNGDALLLCGSAVYGAIVGSQAAERLQTCGAHVYVLASDASACGIKNQLAEGLILADYTDFVALSAHFKNSQSWY
ncbi:MAG: sulfurtransferase complex subunit TusB [Parahaliea sp.]